MNNVALTLTICKQAKITLKHRSRAGERLDPTMIVTLPRASVVSIEQRSIVIPSTRLSARDGDKALLVRFDPFRMVTRLCNSIHRVESF